mmetsp:Transcript_34724/g.53292  ORF Transcript_34724/g.53292 Transcript_34724/m.53292 type:complete len:204 (+) Transcript_34724:409-1020(+)
MRLEKEMTTKASAPASGAGKKRSKEDPSDPPKLVRILENRLDKSMIKFNEAVSISKTYEVILRGLREEKISYDRQLEGLEKAIRAKSRDYDELLLLSHDANHARELAEQDMKDYEHQVGNLRENRMKEIQEKKAAVESRVNRQTDLNPKQAEDSAPTSQVGPQNFQEIKNSFSMSMKKPAPTSKDDDPFHYTGEVAKKRLDEY